nr:probable WRKY transcription factor 50 [Ipomoea batatas]
MLTSLGLASMDGNNHHHHYYYTTHHNDDSTFARQDSGFELSEFFDLDVWPPEEDPVFAVAGHPQNPGQTTAVDAVMVPSGGVSYAGPSSSITDSGGGMERTAAGVTEKFAFKTKSDIEILDDGYKWRKYGKKKVKNSPNPSTVELESTVILLLTVAQTTHVDITILVYLELVPRGFLGSQNVRSICIVLQG